MEGAANHRINMAPVLEIPHVCHLDNRFTMPDLSARHQSQAYQLPHYLADVHDL